jgi:hypothetical protein
LVTVVVQAGVRELAKRKSILFAFAGVREEPRLQLAVPPTLLQVYTKRDVSVREEPRLQLAVSPTLLQVYTKSKSEEAFSDICQYGCPSNKTRVQK